VKSVLEPLVRIAGVRLAALISDDGVPIALVEGQRPKDEDSEERDAIAAADDLHAFAGLAAGWLTEMDRAVAPLSWEEPVRVVLKATRGALILHRGPGAVLLTVLEHGAAPEELRVPMEGAVGRMSRLLREMGAGPNAAAPQQNTPPSLFPATGGTTPTTGIDPQQLAGNPLSETSGDH
jgi:predicted regulator of Ras-like GTPase activity (Roadblock/LC7/MglB family)